MPYDIIIGRTEADRKKFGDKGTIFLGKSYVKMGKESSLSNNVFLDIARSHAILVSGKRGSGKCLHEDSLITLNNGKVIPIKDLKNNQQNIFGLNEKLKIQELKKEGFYKRQVNKLLKIKLRSGKEIKLTPEHPLLTIKGWKPAIELTINNRIATPRNIPSFGKDTMENYKIKLLAYLIAEGHTKKVVLFANNDKKIIEEFEECIRKLDPNLKLVQDKKNHYRIIERNYKTKCMDQTQIKRDKEGRFVKGNKIKYKKRSIRIFIEKEDLFGLKSTEKFVPIKVMQLPKEKLALFLNRLFSCDGSIYFQNGWQISYSSSSKKLIKQVQHLLLRFGVLSRLRNKKIKYKEKYFNSFELEINGENVVKFIKEIGFYGKKELKQKLCLKESINIIRNPNWDTIPKEIWETYRPKNWATIGREFEYTIPKALRGSINYSPSRQKLMQIAKVDENKAIYRLATSDIFWDEITGIEELEGNFTVYDISVPQTHNFIANDIIVHNSYTLGVISEGIADLPEEIAKNLSILIFDTMGIFWTMKFKNEKDEDLLEEWGLKPKTTDINIYTPLGKFQEYKEKDIPTDYSFSIRPDELTAEEWFFTLTLKPNDPVAILIEKIIFEFEENNIKNYSIHDIINAIRSDRETGIETKHKAINKLESTLHWGIFHKESTDINKILEPGKISVLDLSCYTTGKGGWNVKSLVIGLLSKKLFNERIESRKEEEIHMIKEGYSYLGSSEQQIKKPLVWIIIDEAHEFLREDEKTAATDTIINILREGRQPGISLILATQQPGKIHRDVITQSDIILSHRVTAKPDIESLNNMMQSYMTSDIMTHLNNLPKEKGACIILDDNSERIYPIRVRPRFTWHGGESPSAVEYKKELNLGLE
jgi:hypothetical protein